jgi:DNA-binding winged helix-turn-helix (wHTH) protein
VLCFAGFRIDQQRIELRGADGQVIRLRPKSFQLLQFLTANAGRVLSKQELMDACWPDVDVGEDSLFQCIREIRVALGDSQRQIIRTIFGRGYLFGLEVRRDAASPANPAEAALPEPAINHEGGVLAEPDAVPAGKPWWRSRLPGLISVTAVASVGTVFAVALAMTVVAPRRTLPPAAPTIAALPIIFSADADP